MTARQKSATLKYIKKIVESGGLVMGLTKCPDCGRTISDHLDICPACGHRPKGRGFYPGKPKSTAIPVRCPWCGKMVPAGGKSCPGCGSPAKVTYSMAPRRLMPMQLDHAEKSGGLKKRGPVWPLLLLAALLGFVIVWGAKTLRRSRTPAEPAPVEDAGGAIAQDTKTTLKSANALSRVFFIAQTCGIDCPRLWQVSPPLTKSCFPR